MTYFLPPSSNLRVLTWLLFLTETTKMVKMTNLEFYTFITTYFQIFEWFFVNRNLRLSYCKFEIPISFIFFHFLCHKFDTSIVDRQSSVNERNNFRLLDFWLKIWTDKSARIGDDRQSQLWKSPFNDWKTRQGREGAKVCDKVRDSETIVEGRLHNFQTIRHGFLFSFLLPCSDGIQVRDRRRDFCELSRAETHSSVYVCRRAIGRIDSTSIHASRTCSPFPSNCFAVCHRGK